MSTRDRLADIGLFLFAAGFALITADPILERADPSHHELVADQITSALACAALFLRRRWPVQLAVVPAGDRDVAHLVTGPILVALFTVAAGSRPRTTGWVMLLAFAPVVPLLFGRDPSDTALAYFALLAARSAGDCTCGRAGSSSSRCRSRRAGRPGPTWPGRCTTSSPTGCRC
jgi:hypothetical protein